jgi:glycosyltransferase involved in cell wall biosynthesis
MVQGCLKYVDRVVVVDDGSSDATADLATSAGAHVIRHEWNAGYGAALRTCFETAREMGADRMVVIDADGQHSLTET